MWVGLRSPLSAGVLGLAVLGVWLGSCGPSSAPSPYSLFDPGAVGGGGGGGGVVDAGPDADSSLGGPCITSDQCDDGVDCTFDQCDDDLGRCRFVADDSTCQNGLFCDGVERCALELGCTFGPPVTCTDGDPCTIDGCDELTGLCVATSRDMDGDGDPDGHCTGGHDCNDLDPTVSSTAPEICGNVKDDDCDSVIDEAECVSPTHDGCLDPLELTAPGVYALSTFAAALDYGSSCALGEPATVGDVVAAVMLEPGAARDVQLTAHTAASAQAEVALALLGQCDLPPSEIACSPSFEAVDGGRIAKIRGRSLGDGGQSVALPAYLYTSRGASVTLRYEVLAATEPPPNETCGTAALLEPSVPVTASVVGVAPDLASACAPATGDLVYEFTLLDPADVDLYASSIDGDGWPAISLRSAGCALPEDELVCHLGPSAHIYRHSLPPGDYAVAVAASAPTDVSLVLELSAPTAPPDDEDCSSTAAIPLAQTTPVTFEQHQDDIDLGCLAGAPDGAYALELAVASDVLLLGRFSSGDPAAVELARAPCAEPSDLVVCGRGTLSPLRARARNVPAGPYRVIAESTNGSPMQLTALARPAVPPTLVPFSDGCADALTIDSQGGFYQGNTTNATADFNAGCDQGGYGSGGARDQLLRLDLAERKRVVLDMQGSAYSTLLDVRRGPSCPGTEVVGGCAAGHYQDRSFLDLELEAGTYFLQIDGFAGAYGPWFLDVHVVDP